MSDARRLVQNSLFMSGSVVGGGVLLFAILVVCARYLGVARFGDFTLVIAIASIFQLFADGGIVNITIRDAAREHELGGEILGTTKALAWIVTLVLFIVLAVFAELLCKDPAFKRTIYLMGAASLAGLHGSLHTGILRAREDMGVVALGGLGHKILLLGLVLAAVRADAGIEGIAAAHLAANVAQWWFVVLWVRWHYTRSQLRVDRSRWRYLMREATPLGAGLVLRRLTVHLCTFLLTALAGVAAVGLYSSAYRFVQMIEVGAIALAGVLFPALAKAQKASMLDLTRLYGDSLRAFVVISAPVAGLLVALGDDYVLTIYGSHYGSAGTVLRILGASLVLLVPGALAHSVFAALGRQSLFMRVSIIGVTINAAVGAPLVYLYGSVGAAWTTLITEAFTFAGVAWLLRSEHVVVDYLGPYGRVAVPAALLAIPLAHFAHGADRVGLVAATVAYLVAYAALVFAAGGITTGELKAIALRPRRSVARSGIAGPIE